MENQSSKPAAQQLREQLLARLETNKQDAEVFKTLWLESFPPDLLVPPDWELKNAVRRLSLSDLAEGIQSYLVKLSKGDKAQPSTQGALKYICATAHTIKEQENPDQEYHPTARRVRVASRDPGSDGWDGEAWGNASGEERQKIIAENIAKERKEKKEKKQKKGKR
jgi:hypothetical protein